MGRDRYLITGVVVALAFLFPSMISDVYAESSSLSRCDTLDIPDRTYILSQDLLTMEVCFKIIADGITLDGAGHTITSLITPEHVQNIGVDISGTTGVTVKNLNISDFRYGIYVTASDTSILYNTVTNSRWDGIRFENSCGITITGNTVNDNHSGIRVTYSSGATITENIVNNNLQEGIIVYGAPGNVISRNTVISNTPSAVGIVLGGQTDGSFLIENIASGNQGIVVAHTNNNTIIKNKIESCNNCNISYSIGVVGIQLFGAHGNTISQNDIASTHLWGIFLVDSNDNTISSNVISNHQKEIASNARGFMLRDSHDNTFNYNTISNNEMPYEIWNSANNKIYNNNFFSNFNEGLMYDVDSTLGVYSSVSTVFNLDLPIGGNYWDNFDESSEGCVDLNNDNICDSPLIDPSDVIRYNENYPEYYDLQDNFPWSVPDGWLVNSPTIPDLDSIILPDAPYCPNSEPEPEIIPEPEPEIIPEPEPEIIPEPEPEIIPEPEPEIIPEPEPIENYLGLMCHIPPGNKANPQNILIPTDAYPAHLAHGDHVGVCNGDELLSQEFLDEFVIENETLEYAIDTLTDLRDNLNSDTDVEYSISQAAELHILFAHEDKIIKQAFQSAFKQFNKEAKAYYGDTQAVSETKLLRELDKTELKMQLQIQKAEKKEQIENKKQATIQFVNTQKELQKIKNQIAIAKLQLDGDNENLEILKSFELNLLKQTLFFTAQVDGEKVSPQLLNSINDWAKSEIENNHKKNDGNNGNTGSNGKSDSGR